jgi:hypothetical protein
MTQNIGDEVVGVMQPYLFPYLGYFQLINAVNHFVFYDDVNFIKGGWINRNRISIAETPTFFTVPLNSASSFKKINQTGINQKHFERWKTKFLRTLCQSYKKAPHFKQVYPLVENIFLPEYNSISDLAIASVKATSSYLNLSTGWYTSSGSFSESSEHNRVDRLIYITKSLNSKNYVNLIGGKALYNKSAFLDKEIALNFLEPTIEPYRAGRAIREPGLSIIDEMMWNSKDQLKERLQNYKIV